ncbi:MAG: hypothetical protein MUF10_14100, partial [Thermoanaerobaculaceae bacterium]|nr:hypothetical protein [Thermoanaerobaculaceae bacterium]
GGSESHEFMVLAETGEDAVAACTCGYGANVEKASTGRLAPPPDWPVALPSRPEPVHTPGQSAVADVAAFLKLDPSHFIKTMIFESDQEYVVALVRGDDEVNEIKLRNALGCTHLQLASETKVEQVSGGAMGYSGPVGLKGVRIVADPEVMAMPAAATGANRGDYHLVGVVPGRDFGADLVTAIRTARIGDPCPRCGTPLDVKRGIEVGHIFKLGTKYSTAMQCNFLDAQGGINPMIMGCYGLGIGRTVAAAVEQNHDESGIIWPRPLAPFEAEIIALNPDDPTVRATAEQVCGPASSSTTPTWSASRCGSSSARRAPSRGWWSCRCAATRSSCRPPSPRAPRRSASCSTRPESVRPAPIGHHGSPPHLTPVTPRSGTTTRSASTA